MNSHRNYLLISRMSNQSFACYYIARMCTFANNNYYLFSLFFGIAHLIPSHLVIIKKDQLKLKLRNIYALG